MTGEVWRIGTVRRRSVVCRRYTAEICGGAGDMRRRYAVAPEICGGDMRRQTEICGGRVYKKEPRYLETFNLDVLWGHYAPEPHSR